MKTKIAINNAQQGDVILRKLSAFPSGTAVVLNKLRCVLADGEHTGHQHVVESNDAELIQVGERMLLKLTKQATVVHPEHNPITLSPGIWEVGRVKEYDWFEHMERQVID